jgi:D-amino peptidase
VKIYVKADMEGVTGIVSPEQLYPDCSEYLLGRRMLMNDLNAVLEGIYSVQGAEALVYDMHGEGRNVDLEGLTVEVPVICGKPSFGDDFCFGMDDSVNAVFLVGSHACCGAPGAILCRTYDDCIEGIKINDTPVGEIGCEAALAGEFGVPLAFVSADSAGVREARELLGPELEAVEVKHAVSETAGICLPASDTRRLLRAAAAKAVQKASELPPMLFEAPTKLEVVYRTPQEAAAAESAPSAQRTGEKTVLFTGERFLAAYRSFVLSRERRA